MKVPERLRSIDRGTVVAVLLVLLVSGALVGGIAVAVNAFVFNTHTSQDETPHARFQFDQHNATVPADGGSERTVVEISQKSGVRLDQGNVTVAVNGKPAWDVRTDENGTAVIAAPWSSAGEPVAQTDVRIVAYGEGEAGDPFLNATAGADEEPAGSENASAGENESDGETDEEATDNRTVEAAYEPLEEGDVVEIVWRDDESGEMIVLQRYVVEASPDVEQENQDGDTDNESETGRLQPY